MCIMYRYWQNFISISSVVVWPTFQAFLFMCWTDVLLCWTILCMYCLDWWVLIRMYCITPKQHKVYTCVHCSCPNPLYMYDIRSCNFTIRMTCTVHNRSTVLYCYYMYSTSTEKQEQDQKDQPPQTRRGRKSHVHTLCAHLNVWPTLYDSVIMFLDCYTLLHKMYNYLCILSGGYKFELMNWLIIVIIISTWHMGMA